MDTQTTLEYVKNNPNEFKWCKGCNCFNHRDNTSCHHCGSKDFEIEIDNHIKEEIEFEAYAESTEPKQVYYTIK